MPLDVIVTVNLDAKPKPAEAMDILLLDIDTASPLTTYHSLRALEQDFAQNTAVYQKAFALFNQGKTTLSDSLFQKIRVAGIDAPTGATAQDRADELIEKIDELRETDDDWYLLLTTADDDETTAALAAYAEASEITRAEQYSGIEDHRKLYVFQTTNKTPFIENRRAIGIYTHDPAQCADAALVGNVGPFYPQSVTWKFKRPQGLTPPPLSRDEKDDLDRGHLNYMTREHKREYIKEGVCCDGEFIDNQLAADWIAVHIREEIYDLYTKTPKIPYSDSGFAIVTDSVFRALNRAVELEMIAKDPQSHAGIYSVDIPTRASATDTEARERRMPVIHWSAQLDGAVHRAEVEGWLYATLAE